MRAETIKQTIGDLSSQNLKSLGGALELYLFSDTTSANAYISKLIGEVGAHIDDFLQAMTIRLLIPEETLNTNDKNQNRFTALPSFVLVSWYENCSVVAVTLEKNVAIVVILAS